jgi:glutamine amidotransferase
MGKEVRIVSDPGELLDADSLVLPGVGAFRDAMGELTARELVQPIRDYVSSGRPFLGICLGLQLLFEQGEEGGQSVEGLGILEGDVVRIEVRKDVDGRRLKIPHMGWNQVRFRDSGREKFHGIPDESHFYFVHSYRIRPKDESVVAATVCYGTEFPVAVSRENLFAVQFHPEKSQEFGRRLLENVLSTD